MLSRLQEQKGEEEGWITFVRDRVFIIVMFQLSGVFGAQKSKQPVPDYWFPDDCEDFYPYL